MGGESTQLCPGRLAVSEVAADAHVAPAERGLGHGLPGDPKGIEGQHDGASDGQAEAEQDRGGVRYPDGRDPPPWWRPNRTGEAIGVGQDQPVMDGGRNAGRQCGLLARACLS